MSSSLSKLAKHKILDWLEMKDSHLKQKIRDQMEYERVKTWQMSFPCCLFVSFSKIFLKIKIYFEPERKKRPNFIIDRSDSMNLLFEQKVFEMHHFYTLIIFHSCCFLFLNDRSVKLFSFIAPGFCLSTWRSFLHFAQVFLQRFSSRLFQDKIWCTWNTGVKRGRAGSLGNPQLEASCPSPGSWYRPTALFPHKLEMLFYYI